MDINKFLEVYSETYEWLYDKEDKVDGFLEALDLYEVMIQNDKQFKEFVRLAAVSRGDAFTSDRECVALILTCEKLKIF